MLRGGPMRVRSDLVHKAVRRGKTHLVIDHSASRSRRARTARPPRRHGADVGGERAEAERLYLHGGAAHLRGGPSRAELDESSPTHRATRKYARCSRTCTGGCVRRSPARRSRNHAADRPHRTQRGRTHAGTSARARERPRRASDGRSARFTRSSTTSARRWFGGLRVTSGKRRRGCFITHRHS